MLKKKEYSVYENAIFFFFNIINPHRKQYYKILKLRKEKW